MAFYRPPFPYRSPQDSIPCARTCAHTLICTLICSYAYLHPYMLIRLYTCIYAHMPICMFICSYAYTLTRYFPLSLSFSFFSFFLSFSLSHHLSSFVGTCRYCLYNVCTSAASLYVQPHCAIRLYVLIIHVTAHGHFTSPYLHVKKASVSSLPVLVGTVGTVDTKSNVK